MKGNNSCKFSQSDQRYQPTDPRSLANFKQDKYTENHTKAHHSNNAENKDKILERWWGKGSNDSMTAISLHYTVKQ